MNLILPVAPRKGRITFQHKETLCAVGCCHQFRFDGYKFRLLILRGERHSNIEIERAIGPEAVIIDVLRVNALRIELNISVLFERNADLCGLRGRHVNRRNGWYGGYGRDCWN